jgi:adenylosuccinate lyase
VVREQAYEWVQSAAMAAMQARAAAGAPTAGDDFRALLKANPDVTRVLPPAEIDRCFDLDHQLRHVDDLFKRVFGRA